MGAYLSFSTDDEINEKELSLAESEMYDQPESTAVTKLHDLPYRILLKIFSYLSMDDRVLVASDVCKFWFEICSEPCFWNEVDLGERKELSDEILLKYARFPNNVLSVNLLDSSSESLTCEGLIRFSKLCPKIEVLNVKNCTSEHLGDATLIAISANCTKLKRLNSEMQNLTDVAMRSFATNLAELERLNITQNSKVTDDGMIDVIKHCTKLKELVINQNTKITGKTLIELGNREKSYPIMEELYIAMTGIEGKDMHSLRYLTNLRLLDLSRCRGICYESLEPILTNCKKLNTFYVSATETFNDDCVELAMRHLTELEEVYFSSLAITDQGMDHMAKYGKKLLKIHVPFSKVTHLGAENVCQSLPNLQHLGLTSCSDANEDLLELLVQRYPRVTFSTFLQDVKRMLVKSGRWRDDGGGIATKDKILQTLNNSNVAGSVCS